MNLEELRKNGVLSLVISFENLESIDIPIEAFESIKNDNETFEATVNLDPNIIYKGVYDELTPLQRINQYNDITSIDFISRNDKIGFIPEWYDEEPNNPYNMPTDNRYQLSKMISWNKIVVSINKNNIKNNNT